MARNTAITISIYAPDAAASADIGNAVARDPAIHVAAIASGSVDIAVIHAGLFEGQELWQRPDEAVPVVVAFASNDPTYLASLLAAGVLGYHCAGEPPEKLVDAIHSVYRGETRSDPRTMDQLLQLYRGLLHQSGSRRRRNYSA